MRSYRVKENPIGSVVSEILRYKQTDIVLLCIIDLHRDLQKIVFIMLITIPAFHVNEIEIYIYQKRSSIIGASTLDLISQNRGREQIIADN